MSTVTPSPVSLPGLARWVAEESLLFATEGSPFDATVHNGDPRLMVVVGENASGKSLFLRILAAKVNLAGAVPITLSIRERTGAGSSDVSGLRRVMMFGDEAAQSTGATSVTALNAAFGNLDRPTGTILALDEPELGLSDGYARALGEYIGQQTADALPDTCAGVVVVTHSRSLITGLLTTCGVTPTLVSLGRSATLEQWLADPEVRTVEDLLSLADVGRERFRWAGAALRD